MYNSMDQQLLGSGEVLLFGGIACWKGNQSRDDCTIPVNKGVECNGVNCII